jgi:Ca2+/H+ antiporter, TMEM165/GDT1 family
MLDIENLGLLGAFVAGAIPWMEAIAVVPVGIVVGLDPVATLIAAVAGNAITIVLFAYFASNIRKRLINKRVKQGKSAELPKLERALKAFDKYGVYGLAVLGPIFIGTQFAAAAAVTAGVKPLRASILIIVSLTLWAIAITIAMVTFEIKI